MRATLFILVLLSTTLASADGSYRAAPSSTESLPPGLWFRGGHYEDYALEAEPATPPAFAAIAGRFQTAARAEQASRHVDRTHVGLGYPWIVANHDLHLAGACRDEIVVVAGLFTTSAEARAWQSADRARRSLRVVALDAEDASSCTWTFDDEGQTVDAAGHHIEVVHVEPTRDAPGYRASDLEPLDAMVEDRRGAIASLVPACTVPRGTVHAFDEPNVMYRFGWRYAPARCGGETVYVPVEHTMRSTLIETRNGSTRLLQITDVSCDSPAFDAWAYSIDGRAEIPGEPPTFTAPCAG